MATELDQRPDQNQDSRSNSLTDRLNEQFKAPSAQYPDSHPSAQKSLSQDQLKDAEQAADSTKTSQPDDDEKSLYKDTPPKKKVRGRLSRTQKGITGALAGLLVGGFLSAGIFLQGPFQFIHISQFLQNVHFASNNLMSGAQSSKLMRYLRNTNNPERRNLGFFSNQVADRYHQRLIDAGVELNFETRGNISRTIQSISFDPNTEIGRNIQKNIAAQGVNLPAPNPETGRINITLRGQGSTRQARLVTNGVMQSFNLRGVSSRVGSHILRKRMNVDYKPLKNKVREVGEDVRDYRNRVRQEAAESDRHGARRSNVSISQAVDADGQPISSNQDGANQDTTRQEIDAARDIQSAETGSEARRRARSYALRGMGAAGLMCMVKGIADAAESIQYANVILPLIRVGMRAISTGSQVQTNIDASADELAALSESLHDPETKTTWYNARSIQHELGQPLTGPDIPEVAQPTRVGETNGFLGFVKDSSAVGAVCSTAGQLLMLAAGGISNIITEAAMTLGTAITGISVQEWMMDRAARIIAAEEVDLLAAGAEYGNYINYGARLAASDAAASMGGVVLSDTELAELRQESEALRLAELQQQPLSARLLDPTNSYSLVSQLALRAPNTQSLGYQLASSITSPLDIIASTLSSFTARLFAAGESYDYGFDKRGFSLAEIDHPALDDPYENAAWIEATESSGQTRLERLAARYEKCFGTIINSDGTLQTASDSDIEKLHTQDYPECQDPSFSNGQPTEFLRYREYLKAKVVEAQLACYEGLDESVCAEVGIDNSGGSPAGATPGSSAVVIGDPNEPSNNIPCAPGTKDLGTETAAYNQGRKIPTRLCEIVEWKNEGSSGVPGYVPGSTGGVIVNSRVSGAWLALYQAAKADGYDLRVTSAFRTHEHQQRNCGPQGRHGCARPGYSNHQTGHAIDFLSIYRQMGGRASRTSSCSARQKAPNNPEWQWLVENAPRFGFGQLHIEAWHWDAGKDRCR